MQTLGNRRERVPAETKTEETTPVTESAPVDTQEQTNSFQESVVIN